MAHADIALALLAAGRSKRFGDDDKLTSWLGGRMLIEWAASAGRKLPARWHFLIAPSDAGYDPATLGYIPLINATPELGMASSLRIAAAEAERVGARALIVMLADMPFIAPDHLERLITTFLTDNRRPVFSRAGQCTPQPPVLFPAEFFSMLQSFEGDKGARALAAEASFVETPEDQLTDIDTAADLHRANQKLERRET